MDSDLLFVWAKSFRRKRRAFRWDYVVWKIEVEPLQVNLQQSTNPLIQCIQKGDFILYHGVTGIGKTKSINYAKQQLSEQFYIAYVAIMEHRKMYFENLKELWFCFARHVLPPGQYEDLKMKINDAEDFINLFKNTEPFGGKKVIIFIDGWRAMYHCNEPYRLNFMKTLQYLKDNRNKLCLHSVVASGSLQIMELVEDTQVFLFDKIMAKPGFTIQETRKLFQEYCSDWGYTIHDKTVKYIYDRTCGHPNHLLLYGEKLNALMQVRLD
jgi:hypothetical protein